MLRCADGAYYCGICKNMAARLAQHNGVKPGGAKFTRGRRPVALLEAAAGLGHGEALRLEAKIKRMPKRAKAAALAGAAAR